MKEAAVITVGDEVLNGDIVNKNLSIIARFLDDLNLRVKMEICIGDSKEEINWALQRAVKRAGFIFITGGLGPTEDDKTRFAVADFLKKRLIFSEDVWKEIEKRLKDRGILNLDVHKNYAWIPEGFIPIKNPLGLAPGLYGETDRGVIILLPGPPRELQSVLQNLINFIPTTIGVKKKYSLLIKTFEIRETELVNKLEPLKKKLGKVSYYPSIYGVRLKVYAESEELLIDKKKLIESVLGEYVYGTDEETLENVVGNLLKRKNIKISVAESCTGGLISSLITDVPGSSEYFLGGIVAYSNDVKIDKLGVKREDIENYGAVSKETAYQMAKGVKDNFRSNIGISATGIAGPTGATPSKPVGLVFIGIATVKSVYVRKRLFGGSREEIKRQTAYTALDLLRRTLLGYTL